MKPFMPNRSWNLALAACSGLLLFLLPGTAHAQRRIPALGMDLSVFVPSSAHVRDRFGGTWIQFSPGIGDFAIPNRRQPITLDFGGYVGRRGDNQAFLLPIGVQYGFPLNKDHAATPYVRFGPSFLLSQIRDEQNGIRAGWRTGFGFSALTGVTVGRSGFVEVRYSEFSKIRGLNLSGTQFGGGFRIRLR